MHVALDGCVVFDDGLVGYEILGDSFALLRMNAPVFEINVVCIAQRRLGWKPTFCIHATVKRNCESLLYVVE